jgi:Flp pilus assembly protein TadD
MMPLGSQNFTPSFSLAGLYAMEQPGAIDIQLAQLLAAGKRSEADSLSQRYLSEQPASSERFLRIGRVYFEHDQWEQAANLLRESIELQSQNDTAHLLLGLSLAEMKQSAEAERELLIAVQQNPRSDVNCYFAGEQLLRRGKYEASLPYFYKAVELNPKNSGAYRALGSALARTGSYGLAENYYKRAIDLAEQEGTQSFEPYLDLSYLLLLSNQKETAGRALEYARKAIALNAQSADAHYMCGKALLKLERYSEARSELLTAGQLNPEDARPFFLLAQVYERLGDAQQARTARQTFARLSKKSATEP